MEKKQLRGSFGWRQRLLTMDTGNVRFLPTVLSLFDRNHSESQAFFFFQQNSEALTPHLKAFLHIYPFLILIKKGKSHRNHNHCGFGSRNTCSKTNYLITRLHCYTWQWRHFKLTFTNKNAAFYETFGDVVFLCWTWTTCSKKTKKQTSSPRVFSAKWSL